MTPEQNKSQQIDEACQILAIAVRNLEQLTDAFFVTEQLRALLEILDKKEDDSLDKILEPDATNTGC